MKARKHIKVHTISAKYRVRHCGHARQMAKIIALCRKGFSDAQIEANLPHVFGFRPPIPPPRKVYEMIAEARSMLKTSRVVAVSAKGRSGIRAASLKKALKA